MNKIFNPDKNNWSSLQKRPTNRLDAVKNIVDEIFTNVELEGDKALINYTNKFDQVNLNNLIISDETINNSKNYISKDLKKSIDVAFKNIYKFHKNQIFNLIKLKPRQEFTVGKKKELLKMLVCIFLGEQLLCFPQC